MEARQSQHISGAVEVGNNSAPADAQDSQQLRMAVEDFEKQFLLDALDQNQGNKAKTAAMLGIDRKTLYTKLKKYGVL